MLETLRIENLAIIDSLEIEFGPGLTVLTGETGAGKSILVDALMLALGGRASAEVVRSGAAAARVDAQFSPAALPEGLVKILEAQEIELDHGALVLSRVVTSEGRSRAYAAGRLVPAGTLAAISAELVEIHGQHAHQFLTRAASQLRFLDEFGALDETVAELADNVRELRAAQQELAQLSEDDRELARQVEYMRFAVSEIAEADPQVGELEDLESRRKRMMNAEQIYRLTGDALNRLVDDPDGNAASDSIGRAEHAIDELAQFDETFGKLGARLTEAAEIVAEIVSDLQSAAEATDFDPSDLDRVNERMNLLRDLQRKYGDTFDDMLAYRQDAERTIERYASRDSRMAELREGVERLEWECDHRAEALSKARKTAGKKLAGRVTQKLRGLGMPDGVFDVALTRGELTGHGWDQIEFMFSANAGEPPKPLRKAGSGGELSRVMLALKSSAVDTSGQATAVFDEVDAGVGGAAANNVAAELSRLGESRQVLCVTHLPQIATAAHGHLRVTKKTSGGRTVASVEPVAGESRVAELARMLDGTDSEAGKKHARSMLTRKAS